MSDVDICNLALTHIGDPGLITSISPPDGSAQAARCAVLYPVARRMFLESRDWSFATKRETLAAAGTDAVGPWLYRYSRPAGALRLSKILSPLSQSHEPTEPFITELDSTNVRTLLTNVDEAECVYVFDQLDTQQYSPLAVVAISWLLASMLAGAIIKGKAGVNVAAGATQQYGLALSMASAADASQHKQDRSDVAPSGIAARA